MARFTGRGALTGARANPRLSRASFPGVVGPEQGNELAVSTCAAKTRIAMTETSARTITLMDLNQRLPYRTLFSENLRGKG
jgi:hypothetical protein